MSFVEKVVKRRRMDNLDEGAGHMNTEFLLPTFNIVESLLSRAG